jgi:hypothetical protein
VLRGSVFYLSCMPRRAVCHVGLIAWLGCFFATVVLFARGVVNHVGLFATVFLPPGTVFHVGLFDT